MSQTNAKPQNAVQDPVDPFAAMLDSHFVIKSSKDVLDELANPVEEKPVEVEEPKGL